VENSSQVCEENQGRETLRSKKEITLLEATKGGTIAQKSPTCTGKSGKKKGVQKKGVHASIKRKLKKGLKTPGAADVPPGGDQGSQKRK